MNTHPADKEYRREQRLAWGLIYFALAILLVGCLGSCGFAFWLAIRLGG